MNQYSHCFLEASGSSSTFVDLLRFRSSTQPNRDAFTFLLDGETEQTTLTYQELDRRSRRIAAQLQALGLTGERALLLYPAGLDFLVAFFGCLYAGVVAVTAYPPRNERNTPRIKAIAKDAQAAIALTTTEILPTVQSLMSQKTDLESLQWLTTDNLALGIEDTWQQPSIDRNTLAFLQYTSGSTGTPKGVMISHGNLLHNADTTYQFMEHSPESKFVTWLPMYHDMGLIGGILQPLYGGFPCIIMPPTSFLQRPYRWLQAISHYKGTTSGGPNFAYELCTQKITPEQKETLDLSSWSVAFNGAEPIRDDTLERFAAAFVDCGFRKEAFYPCYGMAETTLMVSGVQKATSPIIKTVQKSALESNRVVELGTGDWGLGTGERGLGTGDWGLGTGEQEDLHEDSDPNQILKPSDVEASKEFLPQYPVPSTQSQSTEDVYHFVSCGRVIPQLEVAIANPETLSSCKADEIGEIWVSGPSVGQGYWNRDQETAETFHAYLSDTGVGPFLRTGDLGFLQNNQLFITGRAKDLIIIRGRNLYPQDIELTAERSHPSLNSGASAAFTVEVNNEERLVIVQELKFRAKPNLEEVISAIRQAVTEEHEVQVYAVVLIKPGSIAKTSSGKIQRRATRTQFQNGELNVLVSNILKISNIVREETRLQRSELLALSPKECQQLLEIYLIEQEARVLAITPDDISPDEPLSALGLDSLKVFELKNRVEVDLEVEVSVADFFAGMSTRSLATKILAQLTTAALPSISLAKQEKNTSIQPLSFGQQGLWFIHQLTPDSPTYNIPIVISFKGCINLAILQDCLNEIIRRHEVLRTSFTVVDGQPAQIINQAPPLTLAVEDLRSLSKEEHTQEAQRLATEFAQQPFDLSAQSLLRAKILQLSDKNYHLIITMHHIIADGWSIGILIKELAALYEAFSTGKLSLRDATRSLLPQRGTPLPELPIQYRDFVNWQRQWLDGDRIQPKLSYWKQKLSGELPVLNLPTDRPRRSFASCHQTSPVQTFKGAQAKLVLSQTLTKELKNLSRHSGVTLFMTLLTAFKTLLYRYTGQTDILVGSPIASRNRAEIESLIGFFVNFLVLRTDFSGELSFKELLTRVKSTALEAYVHQDLPFEKLVEELKPERDLSYNPLFQVVFVLQNVPIPTPQVADVSISCEESYNGTCKFDLTLFVEEREQGFVVTIEYNSDLFNVDTIDRMLEHYATLLKGIVANPDCCITEMPLLTAAEKHQLVVEWNNTNKNYPQNLCIHQLFEQQVKRTPDAVALLFENQKLTYRKLNEQANQLAHYLQNQGVKPDVLVGICMERSVEMVVALLAILKAGGAYLPLDPAYPQERLEFMLVDAQVPLLLTQQHLAAELINLTSLQTQYQAQVICLDTEWQALVAHQSPDNPSSDVKLEHLVYVIYTSGSTGKPKGVMNVHRGLSNRLLWMQDAYQLTESDRVLQKTPFSFDVSVWEFFWPLFTGAQLVVAQPGGHQDSSYLVELIAKEKITTLHFVPSMLQVFLEEPSLEKCNSLKRVICSGEALSFDLKERFFAHFDTELHNLYGPTEAAIDVTFWNCQHHTSRRIVPIGSPIANTQIYILDKYLQPVPIGVAGELCIAGAGLARGYLNRPDLTDEKFVTNPFEKAEVNKLYKTGDLARYRPDRSIEFLGRIDHQVKLRGLRIELEEIETILNQHSGVKIATVILQEDEFKNQCLVAYLVPDSKQALTVRRLLQFKREGLLHDQSWYELPNGMAITYLNKQETEFSYQEIFTDQVYLQHGIIISEGDCIFDVGANIGLFTLFIGQQYPNSVIYAFEPIPAVFEALRINTALYGLNVKLFNCGLASELKTETFTYYPQLSLISGRFVDGEEERAVVKSFLLNQQSVTEDNTALSMEIIDELLEARLTSEQVTCQLKTLSDVIREHQLERIDLLKVDVEKSELDVLAGIEEEDWSKIRQLVVEVHDTNGRLTQLTNLLEQRGYHVTVEQDRLLAQTWLYNVYAVRPIGNDNNQQSSDILKCEPKLTWSSPKQLIDDVQHSLKKQLPEYMVPSTLKLLDTLPLLPNGKVDRHVLLGIEGLSPTLAAAYKPPKSEVERNIATIWQEVLHLEKVGINDNFFDIGGHSLLMAQVNSKLRAILQRDISVMTMFQYPTIHSLAQYLSQKLEDVPSLQSTRDRANKQIEAINRQKQQLSQKGKKIYD
ncbi:MAG: amino acid adenylation domain-containing protein [Nostoc sp.]|uniref:amino acid adenylation domain-containing protein n=1 Tax=Nostoc sp. TaxID=1180 RepID=UPI002FF227DE